MLPTFVRAVEPRAAHWTEVDLAHAERNKVRASYNQAEYLEERRAMMQQWADLTAEMAKSDNRVAPIKKAPM